MLVDERRQRANHENPQSCFRHAADEDKNWALQCRTLRRAFSDRMETRHHSDSGLAILTDRSRGLSFSVRESQDLGIALGRAKAEKGLMDDE